MKFMYSSQFGSLESKTKITFHGWLNNNSKEYKELLETAAIYVLVSEKENASVALLEAMSAGCAIITTNVSGCPETIGDAGLIIEPKNATQVKQSIKTLVGKEVEYGQKARRRIIKEFNWNNQVPQYERVLLLY